jgi:hypothetical protein
MLFCAVCQVRDEDEECFEMNPIEYIRRDSEGSDSDTRRRTAADLVRALTEKFEAQVTEMFTGYVGKLLQVGWTVVQGEACLVNIAAGHTT